MTFPESFTVLDRIQLLERWSLVQSMAYYELDENISSDFDYDDNAKQLAELRRLYPDECLKSRYFEYFKDYGVGTNGAHYTSGFDLLERVRRSDDQLYRYLKIDALMALDSKHKREGNV